MIYNLNTVLELSDGPGLSYMEAGIHDDIKLDVVRLGKSEKGNNYLAFEFSDASGAKLIHTEWEPTPSPNFPDITGKANTQMGKILQIIKIYLPATELNKEFNTFTEFSTWVATKMNSVDLSTPVRLKVVYNWSRTKNKDYATLPTYSRYPFIEPMSVQPSRLRALTIDRFERIRIPDAEKSAAPNPFTQGMPSEVGVSATQTHDDIPF